LAKPPRHSLQTFKFHMNINLLASNYINYNFHTLLGAVVSYLFIFLLELDQKGGCRYSDPGMLWNGPADLLGHSIGWTSNGVWSEMKFRFNVTDRIGMVWILMILVNYVMMMHGLWWCWWSLIYNVDKQWWYWWYISCKMV
jgi:hypothetical protein